MNLRGVVEGIKILIVQVTYIDMMDFSRLQIWQQITINKHQFWEENSTFYGLFLKHSKEIRNKLSNREVLF
jgi:hypothetical protein